MLSAEQLQERLRQIPEKHRNTILRLLKSIQRMRDIDRALQLGGEHFWAAHYGEKAYLWFYDMQCYSVQTLNLPEEKHYRIEIIDSWEMTRTIAAENVTGCTTIRLPGKEGIAVLARESC